ncbi:MAG: cysteine hydrolase [Candidatus Eremiobacteraeota bacterium]|nr:cysteine hydrolase [Candidatus Eremiobacteraeota bacterium]
MTGKKNSALIVVDMINDFIDPGGALYCGDDARKIIPAIKREIDNAHERGIPVIFVNDRHSPDDREFELFPPHSIEDTAGSEIIPEIKTRQEDYIIYKNRYSAFFNTGLEDILKKLDINHLIIVGVCTNICVLYTSEDAWNLGYSVEIPVDAVATFDQSIHEFALKELKNTLGVTLREN